MAKAKKKSGPPLPTTTCPILSTNNLYVIGDREGDPEDHPLHRRMHAPPTPEMIDSIEQDGVRKPIEVASMLVLRDETGLDLPIMKEDGWEDLYLVVDGARRVDALKEVNARLATRNKPEKLIRTSTIEGGLPEVLATRVISNGFYASDPASVRAAFMASLAARRVSMTDIGRWFALGEKMVRNYLKFNKTIVEVKNAVDAGQVTLTQAMQWADLPPEEQKAELEKALAPPAKKEGGTKGSSTQTKKPARKLIRAIAAMEGAEEHLSVGFVTCCRWVDGSAKAEDVPGLQAILDKIEGKPSSDGGGDKKQKPAKKRNAKK